MNVAQFLGPLLGRPYVEVVEARLPKGAVRDAVSEQAALPRVGALFLWQQGACSPLLQHLHHVVTCSPFSEQVRV